MQFQLVITVLPGDIIDRKADVVVRWDSKTAAFHMPIWEWESLLAELEGRAMNPFDGYSSAEAFLEGVDELIARANLHSRLRFSFVD